MQQLSQCRHHFDHPLMNTLTHIRMVLWSFFGIRPGREAGAEIAKARPLLLVATAMGLTAVFVLALITVATVASR